MQHQLVCKHFDVYHIQNKEILDLMIFSYVISPVTTPHKIVFRNDEWLKR